MAKLCQVRWSVLWTVVPPGPVCQRPLSRVSGPGEHNSVSQRGSSRYGPIHGSYCQCWGNSLKVNGQGNNESALLCHQAGGYTQPNLTKVPLENSRPWGGMPPQRPTIPQGAQTYSRLNKVSPWQPQDHVLPANGCSQENWEKNKDAKEKLKAWSSAATEVSDSSKELGNQIAWLMATLNRAEQGTCPASAPNSPRHRVVGEGGWTGILLVGSW